MPRPARIDYAGARHHVMNRGARRVPFFLDSECYGKFLELLGHLPERCGIAIHAYALMPNHFHLLLESRSARLSTAMAYLQSRYSYWLNRHYDWDGPVFRGRFRNRVVEIDEYWRHLFAYIHLNPVRAHLAETPDQSDWTSHRVYVGFQPRPDWLATDGFNECYGTLDAYRDHVRDLQLGSDPDTAGFDPDEIWEGPETGIVKVHLNAPPGKAAAVPDTEFLTPEEHISRALDELSQVTGLPRRDIVTSPRGRRGNHARWVAAWWLTHWGRVSGSRASAVLGIQRCGVSQLARKAAQYREKDEELDGWMTALEQLAR